MNENEKTLVSFDQLITLLNETLRHDPAYRQGMTYIGDRNGYHFVFSDGTTEGNLEERLLDTKIETQVLSQYKIAR